VDVHCIMTDPTPSQILSGARGDRAIVQDFRPLADSLEWRLGQRSWRERGSKAFTSDSSTVPFTINNDGSCFTRAAEVFFATLIAAEREGHREPDIFVLEPGIGVGLFTRFFLDSFRELRQRRVKDLYDRHRYVAGDYSEKMLLNAAQHGIFGNHAEHHLLRVVDSRCPRDLLKVPVAPERRCRPEPPRVGVESVGSGRRSRG
jgi:hypothetical protein